MTVLFLSRLFYPHIGGVEKHIFEISRHLIQKGHTVIVISEKTKDKIGKKMQKELRKFSLYYIPVGTNERMKKFIIWYWLWKNRSIIASSDIVHCHDVFFWYFPFRFLFPQKPVYTTFHGYEIVVPPSNKAIFVKKLSKILSCGTICVGDYIKKWYGIKPNYVIYGGVNNVKNESSELSAGPLKIILIGRLEKDIGVIIYLHALKLLRNKGILFKIEVFGEGTYRKKFEKFGKVHGFVENVNQFMEKADIVFSSSYLSILEALAHKKIVIALYDNKLKKDYLKESPFKNFILLYNNAHKVVRAVESVINDPWRYQSMREKGSEWAQRQTWSTVARVYHKLWNI